MSRAPRKLSEADLYHVFARGVGRLTLFEDAAFGEMLGSLSPYDLKALGKQERDGYITRLREARVSVRQIERKTGIGRGVIYRARRK